MNVKSPLSKSEAKIVAQVRGTLPSLEIGLPNATATIDPRLDADESFIMLPIDEIVTYEHNPRTRLNPRYDQIKASIRADGITNMLTVTRRDPGSKYTVYGGGNTRLKIAKELFAEGDQRFAVLRVVYKEWPGDAQVISAHLAENENRGDISFWEKAQGVAAFQRELEHESGVVYSARKLNDELRRRGLNYGIRTIQNFAFAVAELAPVGPWLEARVFNLTLRTAVSSLLDVSDKLGQAEPVRAAFHSILERYGENLADLSIRNENSDPEDRVPVVLDTTALIADLEQAASDTLDFTKPQITAMQRLLTANARTTVDELHAAAQAVETAANNAAKKAEPSTGDGSGRTGVSAGAPEQAPLGAMLAGVPPQEPAAAAAADPQKQLQERVHALFREMHGAVPLDDVVRGAPDMPFFYLMDFPETDLAHRKGQQVEPATAIAREALWQALSVLSMQFDGRVASAVQEIPGLHWARFLHDGPEAFIAACAERVHLHFDHGRGDFTMGVAAVSRVLAMPSIGPIFIRLITCTDEIRRRLPLRVPAGYAPTFIDTPDN